MTNRFRMSGVKLSRGKATLAGAAFGGLMLAGATAAFAVSVLLPPGGSLPVPPTTAATEPDLAGVVLHDALVPFAIKAPTGAVLCAGQLQDRVVRSSKTGQLHFYYRIRGTQGTGALGRIITTSFGGLALRVAYRTDGLGTVPPHIAARSVAPGAQVVFAFTDPPLSCAQHQESRFILVKTTTNAFHAGGATRIIATTGAATLVPTVKP